MKFTKKELGRKTHSHRYIKRLFDYNEKLSKEEKTYLFMVHNVNNAEEYTLYKEQFDDCNVLKVDKNG